MDQAEFQDQKNISLIGRYVEVYNNLDSLCWNIPTRVFAANLVSSIAVAIKSPSNANEKGQIAFIFIIVFTTLAIVNYVGARSLWRLWLDQIRMGYILKAHDISNGYFVLRHNTPTEFNIWEEKRGKFKIRNIFLNYFIEDSARDLNVIFMMLITVIFSIVVILALIGIVFQGNHLYLFNVLGNWKIGLPITATVVAALIKRYRCIDRQRNADH